MAKNSKDSVSECEPLYKKRRYESMKKNLKFIETSSGIMMESKIKKKNQPFEISSGIMKISENDTIRNGKRFYVGKFVTMPNGESEYQIEPEAGTSYGQPHPLQDITLVKLIGTGSYGNVYLCKDRKTRKFHAIKILPMVEILKSQMLIDNVKYEKQILEEIDHPFIVKLYWATKDSYCLYMLLEYCCGGDLFSLIRDKALIERDVKFYATEIILAVGYLHSNHIIFRDLKPENILINGDGHIKLTDFGFAIKTKERVTSLCGTKVYLAPEIVSGSSYSIGVDWWATGILIYEMLIGKPPFTSDDDESLFAEIQYAKIMWPNTINSNAKDLVEKLLMKSRPYRLGCMKDGIEDILKHPWFKKVKWNLVLNKRYKPPMIPKVQHEGDTQNFEVFDETDLYQDKIEDKEELDKFPDF